MAGRIRARSRAGSGDSLVLQRLKRFFPEVVELTLEEADAGRGQPGAASSFPCRNRRVPAASSTRLTRLPVSDGSQAVGLVGGRGKGVGFFVVKPRIFGEKIHLFIELRDQRCGNDPVDHTVEHHAGVGQMEKSAADVIPDGLGATADSAMPAGAFDQGVDDLGP